ncbi:translation initiation factor eIF-2B [Marinobacter alkaliphilus]|uniref:Translation initiation factor eIF-2B n=1 Tax=Marinobacter alkaliphilus TaxID=254719 RepID=A0ABZ3E2Z3_9GAMM
MAVLDPQAQALLREVEQDTHSGASQLALTTLRQLHRYVSQQPAAIRLEPLLAALAKARPSMVVIGNSIARLQRTLAQNPQSAEEAVQALIIELESATSQLITHARALVQHGNTILTHSASSVVLQCLTQLARDGVEFSVICTQSSPGFEGHGLASALAHQGVPVTLITDAQVGLFMPRADLVFTGCDCWLADHHFINKSGTLLVALAARHAGTPFWVLADTFRDSPATVDTIDFEEMPADELRGPRESGITVRNIYFEPVPDNLVTGRVSERGVFSFPAEPGR